MKYGLIGEKLGHSFSAEIHPMIADYEYELTEISRDGFDAFMKARDFLGINVTIPYKEAVIPYLDEIDENARKIGAVNTIVNKSGKLYGYNTDFYGMRALISRARISLENKKVVILGTGGTSKTAKAVAESLGAKEILKVSRREGDGAITYDELYLSHSDARMIINTTPVGMFPNVKDTPVDLSHFDKLEGVIDAVYNPLRTRLSEDAAQKGAVACGGLYMLVAQAVGAAELFLGHPLPEGTSDEVFRRIAPKKENIVLIGMPSSGKTTVGKLIAAMTGRDFIDTDEMIVKRTGMDIPTIFNSFGESRFRELECEAVSEAGSRGGRVIATGGGAVLRRENVLLLKQNGRLFFLDRPLHLLVPTEDRPLGKSREDIEKRYAERYGIYTASADETVIADSAPEVVANTVLELFFK